MIKINRIAAWGLMISIFLFMLTGYGMTKGIVDYNFAVLLHKNILIPIVLICFVTHTSTSVRFALMREKLWNTFSKYLLIGIYGTIFFGFLYFQYFYTPAPVIKNTNITTQTAATAAKVFTKEELSQFNGLNGQPAYVAIDGAVYDLSSVFRNGQHYGFSAGQDQSAAFSNKHVKSILANFEQVGTIK